MAIKSPKHRLPDLNFFAFYLKVSSFWTAATCILWCTLDFFHCVKTVHLNLNISPTEPSLGQASFLLDSLRIISTFQVHADTQHIFRLFCLWVIAASHHQWWPPARRPRGVDTKEYLCPLCKFVVYCEITVVHSGLNEKVIQIQRGHNKLFITLKDRFGQKIIINK